MDIEQLAPTLDIDRGTVIYSYFWRLVCNCTQKELFLSCLPSQCVVLRPRSSIMIPHIACGWGRSSIPRFILKNVQPQSNTLLKQEIDTYPLHVITGLHDQLRQRFS